MPEPSRRPGRLRSLRRVGGKLVGLFLQLRNLFLGNGFGARYYDDLLCEFTGREGPSRKAIGDHVCTIFADIMAGDPKLIVELGTRGGESTRAILAAAHHTGSRVLSIDIDPCGEVGLASHRRQHWEFIQADDVDFGRSRFRSWCADNGVEARIDALFIDTSHEYEHTVREIETWLPFVPARGIVLFHDTNMHTVYRRMDNTLGQGWDNSRDVIRAIEDFVGVHFDETSAFVAVTDDWFIRHHPYSSGLTFMKRLEPARGTPPG